MAPPPRLDVDGPLALAESSSSSEKLRAHQRPARPSLGLVVPAGLVGLLVLVPIGATVAEGVSVGWGRATALLSRPLVGTLLVHTVSLVAAVTAACAVVGTGAAWCVERTDLPGRRWWAPALAVPLAVPAFVSSYAWLSLSPGFEGFGGAVLVVGLSYYPLVYLPVAAALRGMDPALEDAARALGHGPWRTFARVVLPQLRPALLGGMLLVSLNVLAEFGAFALLRFSTFTTEIYAEYQASFSAAGASLLSLVLLVCCLVLLWAESAARGPARYARVGPGARRLASPYGLGRARWPALGGLGLLLGAGVGVPLATLAFWLTQTSSEATTATGPSLSSLLGAAGTSVGLGLAGAALTTILAFPVARLASRHRGVVASLVERSTYLAEALPGIVIALALSFVAVRVIRPLYESAALLVIAYAILFLPLAMVAVRASLSQVPPSLEEAARSLGQGRAATLRRVVVPLAGPGLGAGGALVFVSVVTELTTTLLLAPIGTRTLATEVWADTSTLAFAAAAPYATVLVGLSLVATWVLSRRFGAFRGGGAGA
ncbi:MAG: ABC transporter permease [Acidimicrobiales bacterium]